MILLRCKMTACRLAVYWIMMWNIFRNVLVCHRKVLESPWILSSQKRGDPELTCGCLCYGFSLSRNFAVVFLRIWDFWKHLIVRLQRVPLLLLPGRSCCCLRLLVCLSARLRKTLWVNYMKFWEGIGLATRNIGLHVGDDLYWGISWPLSLTLRWYVVQLTTVTGHVLRWGNHVLRGQPWLRYALSGCSLVWYWS